MLNVNFFALWRNELGYPPLLDKIYYPPARLFCQGAKLHPQDSYFAIVGTRHPSIYGQQMAREFSFALAQRGFIIVSGLAYGIDAIAHEAALDAGGRTIAVLGAGLDHLSPPCNRELAKQIEKNGTLLTEYEGSVPPHQSNFPKRNRIIAGMCCATLVIEAPERSGALITARLALEENREVFALPANITQESSRGSNQLIRDGKAFPVTGLSDILENLRVHHLPDRNSQRTPQQILLPLSEIPLPHLNEMESKIYHLLKKSSLTTDQLILETQLPASKISTLLSLLEIKGLIHLSGPYVLVTR